MTSKSNQTQTNQKTSQQNSKNKLYMITTWQAMSLNASTIIGVGVLVMPRSTTAQAHQFGWISVLLGLLIAVISVISIYKLGERFPSKSLVHYTRTLLGSRKHQWVGRVLSFPVVLLYILYWAFVTAAVARTFGEVVVTAVLINTPLEVIVATMLLLCFILSFYDAEVVARVNEVLLLIIVVPVLFISLSAYQTARMENIMPLWPGRHWMDVVKGAMPALTTFLGYEVMMMFNAQLKRDHNMLKGQIGGLFIPGVLYLLIVIAGIMGFGYEEISRQAWPTLELVKTVNVPGLILERLEAVFLGVWVAAVFTTAGNWYFSANWATAQLFGLKKKGWTSLFFLVGIYFAAMKMGKNIEELFKILDMIGYAGMAIGVGIPILLWLLAMVRKIDERKEQPQKEENAREAS
ncbi:MAG: GerAB/ArcD/ProY family transporter [Tumebacillaceae bacterium]